MLPPTGGRLPALATARRPLGRRHGPHRRLSIWVPFGLRFRRRPSTPDSASEVGLAICSCSRAARRSARSSARWRRRSPRTVSPTVRRRGSGPRLQVPLSRGPRATLRMLDHLVTHPSLSTWSRLAWPSRRATARPATARHPPSHRRLARRPRSRPPPRAMTTPCMRAAVALHPAATHHTPPPAHPSQTSSISHGCSTSSPAPPRPHCPTAAHLDLGDHHLDLDLHQGGAPAGGQGQSWAYRPAASLEAKVEASLEASLEASRVCLGRRRRMHRRVSSSIRALVASVLPLHLPLHLRVPLHASSCRRVGGALGRLRRQGRHRRRCGRRGLRPPARRGLTTTCRHTQRQRHVIRLAWTRIGCRRLV